MIIAKANDTSCKQIWDILDKYCTMSGQLVNFHKSAFQVTKNVSDNDKANFSSILAMSESSSLGEYLGCPIIDSRVTKETFSTVLLKPSINFLSGRLTRSPKQGGQFLFKII